MIGDDALMRKVKQLCSSRGVSVVYLSGYRSFALQVEKTRKRGSGHDLTLVVGALVTHYAKLGLDRKVLAEIAYNVFNVVVPPAA
jgi:hypothetical protein